MSKPDNRPLWLVSSKGSSPKEEIPALLPEEAAQEYAQKYTNLASPAIVYVRAFGGRHEVAYCVTLSNDGKRTVREMRVEEAKNQQWRADLLEAAKQATSHVMNNREAYLRAWVAETGIQPSDAVLIERRIALEDGGYETRVFVQHKDEERMGDIVSRTTEPLAPPAPKESAEGRPELWTSIVCRGFVETLEADTLEGIHEQVKARTYLPRLVHRIYNKQGVYMGCADRYGFDNRAAGTEPRR